MRIVTVSKKPHKRRSRAKQPKNWQEAVRMAFRKNGANLRRPGVNKMWKKNMVTHFIKDVDDDKDKQ